MSAGVDVAILAEDVRHRTLIRKHLRKRGYSHHKIRDVLWWPSFQTPCLLFVKDHYPAEVQLLRSRGFRVTTALIAVADADDLTVQERIQEFDDLLAASGQQRRQTNEHIAIIVPRRNVETWLYFLAGNDVEETTDYKPLCKNFDNGEFATRFAAVTWPRGNLPNGCPPSLHYACEGEFRRLP